MKRGFEFLKGHIEKNLDGELTYVGRLFECEDLFDQVPTSRGIYIICSPTTKFQYPKGSSKIMYIGMSNNLRKRLKTHCKYYNKAKEDWNVCENWLCDRYNYMYAFKAEVYYIKTKGNEKEKYLESRALEGFYDRYYATPVGNGAKSFRKTKD